MMEVTDFKSFLLNFFPLFSFFFYEPLRGGVHGQKPWEHDSEITGDPKGPPTWANFLGGF